MEDKPKKNRLGPIPYRPPVSLRDQFHAEVEASGKTTNAFLTDAWTGQDSGKKGRRIKLSEALAGKMVGLLGRIAQDVRTIRQRIGELSQDNIQRLIALLTRIEERLASIEFRLIEIRWALFKLLGRKP